MANGDLSALSVLAGGKFAEFTVAGQTAASVTATASKSPTFACTSASDGSTLARTGIRSRFISATNSGGNAVIRVLLAEPIYSGCSSVTMTMVAGFVTDGTVSSAAAVASSVTNNSALGYPLPFASWWSPPAETYTGVFGSTLVENPVGIVAKSPHLIKKVVFTFTQGGTVITETVSTPTLITSARTLNGLAGTFTFVQPVYLPTTSAASFADGAVVVTATVVPLIGDTNRTTTTSATDFFDSHTVYANTGGTLTPATIFVGAGGNDSNTGLSWAQRLATLDKAFMLVDASAGSLTSTQRDGAIIEIGPGTYTQASFIGNAGYANTRWVVVKPSAANGGTRANTILQLKAQQHGIKFLKWENITLDVTVSSDLDVWSGAAAGRVFWLHKVLITTSNAGGRDGTNIGTYYGANYAVRPYTTDSVCYDFPDRPFLQSQLRRNCTSEKCQVDGCRDPVHTFGDLAYDLRDPLGSSHPDYLQILNATENFMLDGFIALDMDGEPLFLGPSTSTLSAWIANGIVVQHTDAAYIGSVATNAPLTVTHLVIAHVTVPNGLFNLTNITAPGSIAHTNTWYVHNVQRQLSQGNDAGVTSRDCHSTNSGSSDDTSYGFTKGNPGFTNGAYNANFSSSAFDYRPGVGSALLARVIAASDLVASYDLAGDAIAAGSAIGALQGLPAAPSGLTLGAATATTQPLTWTDNSDNETRFDVQYSTSSDMSLPTLTINGTIAANATSYTVPGLGAGTTYWFQVRASNASGSSAWSAAVSGATASSTSMSALNAFDAMHGQSTGRPRKAS